VIISIETTFSWSTQSNLPVCRWSYCRFYTIKYSKNMIGAHQGKVNARVHATPQPESQEEILAAALASLDEHDIPPDEGWTVPDPDSDPPAELSGLTGAELDELCPPTRPPDEFGPAGFLPRDGSGHGSGFADGGALDVLPPGVALAGFADDAHARLGALTDDELIGVLRGWQRQISWSQARKLYAMAELARRRPPRAPRPPRPAGSRATRANSSPTRSPSR
jgi:hypothetical protein